MKHNKTQDCARAAFLALAIGDAMGAPVELKSPQQIWDTYGGELDKVYGTTTDDTAQALALASAIKPDYSEKKAIANYVNWYKTDGYGIGSNSRHVLSQASLGKDPRQSARDFLKERPLRKPSNGALMRCLPLVLRYYNNLDSLIHYCKQDATLTHADPLCEASVVWYAEVLANLINGKKEIFSVLSPFEEQHDAWDETLDAAQKDMSLPEEEFWIYEGRSFTLVPVAMTAYALKQEFSFREGMLWAVNLGGDADTNAALVGAALAIQQGTSSIPQEWQSPIHIADELFSHSDRLIKLANQ